MPFDLSPIGPTLGAIIEGIDARDLSDADDAALKAAFAEHRVLVLRDQSLGADDQVTFSARFGPLYRMPYVKPLADHPDVIAVLKEADEVKVSTFGSWWHADFSYLEEPPVYSILQAHELPPAGGDTLFADLCTAYDALSDGMKAMLSPLKVMHSGHIYGTKLAPDGEKARMRSVEVSTGHVEADVERAHPLVRLHQPSGRPALFCSPTYTTRLEGMTATESASILGYLYEHIARPEFTIRQRWQAGDLLMWDNRAVVHLAVNDYDGHRRLLHRTTVASERPVPAFNQEDS
ncbi:MAG: TauD/TfdA family dioxygenase [Alphaproteobacteria bacterium]|jgi:taurine dioxygenase|nr:taurine dioxygenase [Rhodospirillaceae bacterium]MBT6205802.1 taurine dioxygenase [Rhodospirillaceae bacterium]MBT6511765.1 taurine dioxygenase [Rhodospirillaceae bacterium]MDG2480946.1 TauD/TfdA family dioxygenase [Alphaproteobacteria bacterium]